MPFFNDEELLRMKAFTDLMKEKTQGMNFISLHELQVYMHYAYMYENLYPERWANAIDALENNNDDTYLNLDYIRQARSTLQRFINQHNEKSVNDYNNYPIKPTQPFSIRNLAYKDNVPVQQQCLLLEGDYMRLRDEICLKYEREYNAFHLEAAKVRDEAIAKIENTKQDQEAILEAQMDEEYQKFLRQKDDLEAQIKDLKGQYKKDSKAYQDLKNTSNKAIFAIEEQMQTRLSAVIKDIYDRQAKENKDKIQAINDDFKQKVDGKFREIEDKIKDEFTQSLRQTLAKANKDRENRIQKFANEELEPKYQEMMEELENQSEKPEYSFVDNDPEHYNMDEEEINTSSKKNDPSKKQEEKIEEPKVVKAPAPKKKSPKKPKITEEQLIQESIDIQNYESDMITRTIDAIANKADEAVLGHFSHFMDNDTYPKQFTDTRAHKECWEREKNCVEATYQEDKDRFRVSQRNHFDRINGIHRLLRDNKKKGLSGNSDEYNEVLNQLNIYERGLIEKGWYDVIEAEKDRIPLTKEQEAQKAQMLKQLDNVYEASANYMVKKGPQKKYWGHGQARYELMYLLCNEIYTQGGHGAEARSRIARLEKDIRAGKIVPSEYRHQIPNAAYFIVVEKYETSINQAINGTNRHPGTKQEIAQKREEAKGGNNIIQPNNIIQM